MKNVIRVLGIAIVLLLLAQIVLMFMPYFDFADMVKPTKRDPNPKSVFTLQDYCWMETEDMGKDFFKELIEDYNVNDHAVPLVLTFVFACLSVIVILLNFKNSFNTFITFRAGLMKVVAHAVSCFWGYVAIDAYLTSGVLQFGNQELYMASLNVIFVATALIALHLVLDVVNGLVNSKKARAAKKAALEA